MTDFFVGEITTELLKQLIQISSKSCLCKASADQLIEKINEFLPIIREIKYSGVELPDHRQFQLDQFSRTLQEGLELCRKVLGSSRWNVYKNLHLARKMEKMEKRIGTFFGLMQAHTLADVHHMRFDTKEQLDRVEGSTRRLEQSLSEMRIGSGGWVEEAVRLREEAEAKWDGFGGGALRVGASVEVGKRKVREMIVESKDMGVIGICGIGGSGKTTLAKEVSKDDEIRSYFNHRVLFLTVSQSPNVDQLQKRIWEYITGNEGVSPFDRVPQWNLQYNFGVPMRKTLIVLDDVWALPELEQLVASSRMPGCKTLVVSRFKFPKVIERSYEVELLREQEAMTLFCHSAFGKKSVPLGADEDLVKQVVNECKGLPLALKVIGASLRDQQPLFWVSARKRLARGEPICESHGSQLLDRMAISVEYLKGKVRECFLDLGSFPEDTKVPMDVLINMWVEIRNLDEEEAFAILVELSNKNLITLVKDVRAGERYSSYFEVSVTLHDVLRDLALHLNNQEEVNECKRLLMPKRDEFPREWERNSDIPFDAQIVSVHTGEMNEMDWPRMEFPKAEVLILNFSSNSYFLPPFIENMPKLRALIVINHSTSNAELRNFSVFSSLTKLRSLWLERVCVPHLSETTVPLYNMRKVSLVLCKINDSLDPSTVDLPQIFPCLSELTIDHCDDLLELPSSICRAGSLKNLSITDCHSLQRLPADLHKLSSLEILRMYACPNLRMLPQEICQLGRLKYLDISQCVNLTRLPEDIGNLGTLEKIDMRECEQIRRVPKSASSMKSLKTVICDEELSLWWKDVVKPREDVQVQVADKCFSLDWLDD